MKVRHFLRCRRECKVHINAYKRQIARVWLGTLSGPGWAPQGFICKQSNTLPYSVKDLEFLNCRCGIRHSRRTQLPSFIMNYIYIYICIYICIRVCVCVYIYINSMPSTYLFPANLRYYTAQMFSFFLLKSLLSSKACAQTLV